MRHKYRFLLVVFVIVALLSVAGCKKEYTSTKVDKIVLLQGGNQCVLPGETCKKSVKVELLGPTIKGLFGGKGTREPVANKKVNFIPLDGADLKFEPAQGISSYGGEIDVKVIAGKNTGDQYFKIAPEGSGKSLTVRVTTGVNIEGGGQETSVGDLTNDPIKIKVTDSIGMPVENAKVYFSVVTSPEKKKSAKCIPSSTTTNKDGIAETNVKIGSKTGVYKVIAEVSDPAKGIHYRGIDIKELGFSISGLLIAVLGGLALFIFGMKLMSDGLQIIAGQKMKRVLHFFTKNRFVAVLAGIIVTGAIQSSSACTVMVVGFVNAGLLSLSQAIGIVFGANIGTTVTAQMISFKLEGLALPAIIIGAVMMMFTKKSALKGAGQTVFGFGMLFFGMGMMGRRTEDVE